MLGFVVNRKASLVRFAYVSREIPEVVSTRFRIRRTGILMPQDPSSYYFRSGATSGPENRPMRPSAAVGCVKIASRKVV